MATISFVPATSSLNPNAPAFVPNLPVSNGGIHALWNQQEQIVNENAASLVSPNSTSGRGPMATSVAGAAVAGGVSGAFGFLGSLATAGASIINANADRELNRQLGQEKLRQSQQQIENNFWLGQEGLRIQNTQLNKMWDAAHHLGLYSIDQLGNAMNTDYYKATGAGPAFSRVKRTFGNSPFSF